MAFTAALTLSRPGPAAARSPGTQSPSIQSPGIQFLPRTEFATGAVPYSIAIGDLNGDGIPDLVTANNGSNTVSVLLGDGTGSFGLKTDYAAGANPSSVAIADLNADGLPDLVVTNAGSNSISELLGTGAGGFAPKTDFPTGGTPWSTAVGDLNGDGKPDLAVTNFGANAVRVHIGDGHGGFDAGTDYPITGGPRSVAIGDLNGDGIQDLAVVNETAGTVSVLLGIGAGRFGPKTDFQTGLQPWSVVIGNLNADGKPDLAVANAASSTVSVLLGDGTGGFAPKSDFSVSTNPLALTIGDLDRDGRLDLVAACYDAGTVTVLLGRNAVSFGAQILDFPAGSGPHAVAVGDLDGDGAPDIVTADASSNTAAVLIQATTRAPSTTTLVSLANPSVFGQDVALRATVDPSQALGKVEFFDGLISLGRADLNGSTATFSAHGLSVGTHSLTALYLGDMNYQRSTSSPVQQTVSPTQTSTALTSGINPSVYLQSVSFTAVVSSAPPGADMPTGTVQFRIDGADFAGLVPLSGGHATVSASTLSVGAHSVEATYSGDANFAGSTAAALTQTVEPSGPRIAAVRDVPHDQGGRVFLTWRCPLDQPGIQIVTGYRVWRRAPDPGAAPAARASGGSPAPGTETLRLRAPLPGGRAQDTFWEAIASLPAGQLVSYAFTAPTTQDSIAGSNPYTAFFVTALTADPFVFFQSAPDSGYSVDNLAPPTPAPFTASYTASAAALHWGKSPAPDFGEFRLYRGLSAEFLPGPANLVVATRDTGYVDQTRTPYFYKLAALDLHGNHSRYALVTPNSPVATLASLVAVEAGPRRILLTWYAAGDPGLAATVYRRTEGTAWEPLGTVSADGTGYLRYEDLAVVSGERYGYRLGIVDGGAEVFAGETWATAELQVFALEGARPNPAAGGSVVVFFSLAEAAPARLELWDVSGRRIVAREVGALGPGRHSVDLGQVARIPPGIYLIRLTQDRHSRVTRTAVLE